MAPPLVKGSALARRRASGIVFLAAIAMLMQLSVWLYQDKFSDVVTVSLKANRIGNQLTEHADVKLNGLTVGEVRSITSDGTVATLELALDPELVAAIPRNVSARLLPKTLFGEKQVVLVPPTDPSREHLAQGDVITQDRTAAGLEIETALNDLLPLIKQLEPQKVSAVLQGLSSALRDRGDRLGANLAANAAYLSKLNPALPTVAEDFAGLADFADNLADVSPEFLRSLDNFAATSRSLVQEKANLDAFLVSTQQAAASATEIVAQNDQRFEALARDSLQPLKLFASFSNTFPCLLNRIVFSEIEGSRVLSSQGLHITLETVRDHGPYQAGDEPQYADTRNAGCFGLGATPIRPFPNWRNPQDGYRDDAPPEDPGRGPGGCCRKFPAGSTQLDVLLIAPMMGPE